MSYASLDELKVWLGSNADPPGEYEQLTDRVDIDTANDVVGQKALDDADGVINGYLMMRYETPVSTSTYPAVAASLNGACLRIASWILWQHPARKSIPERARQAYEEIIKWLQAISAGEIVLPLPAIESPRGTTAQAIGDQRVFTRDSMRGL